MSRFVLTAEVQMRGPTSSELNAIASQIRSGLNGVTVPVNIQIPPNQQRVLKNITQDLNKVKASAIDTADSFELLGRSLSQNIRRYGAFTAATGAFIRLGIAIRQSIGEAVDFETEIRKIAQGQGRAISSYAALKNEIDNLSKSLGVSSLSLASTSRILAQAGLSANEVKSALSALAKSTLAPTFGEINETTEASIAIMRQFKIEAAGLESVLGSINQVAADFAVESEDIAAAVRLAGSSFAAASPQFQEGEESFRQFIALFTSVRQTTRGSAESIATGLRTITTRLQRGGTIEYFKSLGIELSDNEGQFIGAYEAIRKVSKALEDIPGTDPRFANIAELLGGYRQIDKTIPLLKQFAVAERAYQSALKGRESLDTGLSVAQETLAVKFGRVREEFNSLVRKISENEGFRTMINLSLKLASSLIKVVEAVTPLLPLITALGLVKLGIALPKIGRGFAADYRNVVGRKADGGKVHYFNKGGIVPGHGNSDTVAAMLTPGERIIPKKDVKKFATAGGSSNLPIGKTLREKLSATAGYPEFMNSVKNFDSLSKEKQIEAAIAYRNPKGKAYAKLASSIAAFHDDKDNNIPQAVQAVRATSDSDLTKSQEAALKRQIKSDRETVASLDKDKVSRILHVNKGLVGALFAYEADKVPDVLKIDRSEFGTRKEYDKREEARKNKITEKVLKARSLRNTPARVDIEEQGTKDREKDRYKQFLSFGENVKSIIAPVSKFFLKKEPDGGIMSAGAKIFADSVHQFVPLIAGKMTGDHLPLIDKGGITKAGNGIISQVDIKDVLGKIFEASISSITNLYKPHSQNDTFDFVGMSKDESGRIKNFFKGPGLPSENFTFPKYLDAKLSSGGNAKESMRKKILNQYFDESEARRENAKLPVSYTLPTAAESYQEYKDVFKYRVPSKGSREFTSLDYSKRPKTVTPFANGGLVPGSGNTDSVPMNLENGQYVIRKKAVEHIGASNLAKFAQGGVANSLVMPGEYIFDKKSASRIGTSTLNTLNHAEKFANGGLKRYAGGTGPSLFEKLMLGSPKSATQIKEAARKKSYTPKTTPDNESFLVTGANRAGDRIKTVVKAQTAKQVKEMMDAIGVTIASTIKMTKTDVVVQAVKEKFGSGGRGFFEKDLTKQEKLRSKQQTGKPLTEAQIAAQSVATSPGSVYKEIQRQDVLAASGVLTPDQIKAHEANKTQLEAQIRKSAAKQTTTYSGERSLARVIKGGSATDSEKQGYKDEFARRFSQKKTILGTPGVTERNLEDYITRNVGVQSESSQLRVQAAQEELRRRRGIKPTAPGGGGVSGSGGGPSGPGGAGGPEGSALESPLVRGAAFGIALQTITALANSVGLLGEGANKAVDGVTHLSLLLGTAFSGLQQVKSFLPKGGQDFIGGIEAKRKEQFFGTRGRQIGTGAALTAGVIAAGAGAYYSSKGTEELSQNKASGAEKLAQGGALTGAATGAAIGVAFGPWGVAIGAAAGAAAGFADGLIKATKAIEGFHPERLSKSIGRINTGAYKTQDLANIKNAAFVQDVGVGAFAKTTGKTYLNALRHPIDSTLSLFSSVTDEFKEQVFGIKKINKTVPAATRAATKEELIEKGFSQDTIINAFANAKTTEELDTKEMRQLAKTFNVNVDTLKSDFAERIKNNKAIEDSQRILDQNSRAAVRYSNTLNELNNKFDKIQAMQGFAAQATDEVRSGVSRGRDFSAFADLAKKGVITPEIESILKTAETGPLKDVAEGAKFEIESARLTKEILTQQAEEAPLKRGGIEVLSGKLRSGLETTFGKDKDKASLIDTEVARMVNILGKEFSGNEEEMKKGLQNAEDVQKLQAKIANADKASLDTLLRFNALLTQTSANIANLGKEAINIKFDTIEKLGANLEQYDATLSNVMELRGQTFDRSGATQANRAIQLGNMGLATGLPIGASGNPLTDVNRVNEIRVNANAQLDALREKKTLGTFTNEDVGPEKQFTEELTASTRALKLMSEASNKVIAADEARATELKQRREAAGSSALGYLTADRKGKQQARKDLDFALRLSQGQVSLRDFSGNAGGVQTAKSLFGEKEAAQMFAKIPGLEKLFKPSSEENALHQQIMLENTARKRSNDLLADQSNLLTAINKEMETFHKTLILANKGPNKAEENKGPGKDMILHGGTFSHNVEFTIKGMNPDLVDRKTVQEMLQVGINKWWDAQHDKAAKVPFNVEHQGAK